jgi:hypothetical protein
MPAPSSINFFNSSTVMRGTLSFGTHGLVLLLASNLFPGVVVVGGADAHPTRRTKANAIRTTESFLKLISTPPFASH